ncbi:hypothetical protein SASPL_127665 [Salvia splendens]|uniref:RING finger and CHY zinc finger domain-containing protein 1 n=1 Tax=Salvia splendens TaxID=180675 RepID=A0A8X8XBA4_SALSN|nr:hypothetical protein SASPL_127665 [Salvia splendens]
MVSVAVNHDLSSSLQVESNFTEKGLAGDSVVTNCIEVCESPLESSHEEHIPTGGMCDEEVASTETYNKGYLNYGCSHYHRRSQIRAPCCNEIFDCHHCHNEAKLFIFWQQNNICIDQKLRHDITRHLIEKVRQLNLEDLSFSFFLSCIQSYAHFVTLNRRLNKFAEIVGCAWEDTIVELASCMMMIYRKTSIIVMAVVFAGSEAPIISFIAINVARCCYSMVLKSSHPCIERAMHQNCPVCFEYLFESRNDVVSMPCGHTIHRTCLEQMQDYYRYACPICSKSVRNMSKVWEKYDLEIAATPMPPYYEDKMVWILCNDCGSKSEVKYHIVGQKCHDCKSYNTRQTRGLGR